MEKNKFLVLMIVFSASILLFFTSCSNFSGSLSDTENDQNNYDSKNNINFKYDITTEKGLIDTINDSEEYERIISELSTNKANSINIERSVVGTTTTDLLGDVNIDGVVDIIDALLVAQYSVGLIDINQLNPFRADINCDKNADILDALLIAQCYVSTKSTFNIKKEVWSTSIRNEGGVDLGCIYLDIEVETDASHVFVKSYGDGTTNHYEKLNKDIDGIFKGKVLIYFTPDLTSEHFAWETIVCIPGSGMTGIIVRSGDMSFF